MTKTLPGAHDLTTEAAVEAYLATTPYACTKAEALSGGNANYVFRLHLTEPYDGKKTLVLKHAQPYIKSLASIPFNTQRQFFEVEALRRIREWSPPTAFVTVPSVYWYDDTAKAIIMDDCGPNAMTLKEYMQRGRCTIETAHRIGKHVGEFLGKLHSWGKGNMDLCETFDRNSEAKAMSSWATYGRIFSTFEGGLEKLQNPTMKLEGDEATVIKKICSETSDSMMKAKGTFVMGDFWPGNLILSCDEAGDIIQIRVIDWEVCKSGLLGLELGQFCAELYLLMQFNGDVCQGTPEIILEDFLRTYGTHIVPDLSMCRQAIVHLGAHLVVYTPTVGWGGKEMTQKVVKEGVQFMVEGHSAEEDWLRTSVVGPLVTSIR